MKSSAKSSAKAPKAPTRRRRKDYLDYLQSQFPLSLCLLNQIFPYLSSISFESPFSEFCMIQRVIIGKDEFGCGYSMIFDHFHRFPPTAAELDSQVWKEHASDCTRRTITNSCSVPSQMAISKSCRSALRLSRTTLHSLIASW